MVFGDAIALLPLSTSTGHNRPPTFEAQWAPLPARTRDAVVECPRGSRVCLLRWTLRFRLVRKMQIWCARCRFSVSNFAINIMARCSKYEFRDIHAPYMRLRYNLTRTSWRF